MSYASTDSLLSNNNGLSRKSPDYGLTIRSNTPQNPVTNQHNMMPSPKSRPPSRSSFHPDAKTHVSSDVENSLKNARIHRWTDTVDTDRIRFSNSDSNNNNNGLESITEHPFTITTEPLKAHINPFYDRPQSQMKNGSATHSIHSTAAQSNGHAVTHVPMHQDSDMSELQSGSRGNDNHHDSFYFDDGIRRIDFIMVYQGGKDHKDTQRKVLRRQFEKNLTEEGLEIEFSKGAAADEAVAGLRFVKIHAPWDVLIRYAEVMKLKMPMKQIETSWRLVFDDEDPYTKGKFTAAFTRDKIYLFDIPDQRDRFFSTSQRSQIVDFILKRKNFASNADAANFGISKLLQEGVYLGCYPLHEGRIGDNSWDSPRMNLVNGWANVSNMFRKQPLDEIRKYLGVKIALYFAWLGFYTSMLIPASLVGVFCFIYGWITLQYDPVIKDICAEKFDDVPMCPLCSVKCPFWKMSDSCAYANVSYLFDNPATVFFAIFMSLWATVYLEMWKRYSARITYRWDLSNFDRFEEYPRPEYLARISKGEKKRLNVITKMYEPYVPFWKKQMPYTVLSGGIVFFLVFVALASVLGVIVYRVVLRTILSKSQDDYIVDYSVLITSSTAAGLNLICILMFNFLYGRVAYYLTELEMPRTQTDFDNSLTLKMYLLQFVNYYSSIFYIAFFKGRFANHPGDLTDDGSFARQTQEECGTGGCLVELAIQLAIIMVGKQALNAFVEMSQPWVFYCIHKYKLRSRTDAERSGEIPQWEDDFMLAQWGTQSLFNEYLEMVLQFGFVTIFVAAFPLAPLFALINNALEIRLDAKKMISSFRRPVAQRVKNIGIWYRILDSIGKLSVLTNAIIIAFTSDFIPRLFFYSQNGSMNGYLNSTLSSFNVSELIVIYHNETEIKDMIRHGHTLCYYQGNREPPGAKNAYAPNSEYWELLAYKLAFVFVFENVIAITTMCLRWLIPDVPQSLSQNIRQHAYLTNELIMQQELKRAKELESERRQDNLE